MKVVIAIALAALSGLLAKADAEASPYRIVYENGVTVEIMTVSVVPSRGKPFWEASGARLIEAPYESRDAGYGRDRGKTSFEITARITGNKEKPLYIQQRAINGVSISFGSTPYRQGKAMEDLRVFECTVPALTGELEFEMGIAANTWQTTRTFKTLGVYGEGPTKVEVVDVQPFEVKSKPDLQFRVKLAPSDNAWRLIAIDSTGGSHLSKGGGYIGRDGHTLEAAFADLPREKIKEYQVQRCAYEWKSIKSIHLKPKGDWQSLVTQHRVKRDGLGFTPLHRAVQQGSKKSVAALLDKGADAQAKDNEGATAMHHAAKLGRDELIMLLLKHGASINATDSAGRTPLQWVTQEKTKELLLEHGATPGTIKQEPPAK
jgi:hypothetical protein